VNGKNETQAARLRTLTTTGVLVASIGDAKNLESGRQVAAPSGLVPKHSDWGGTAIRESLPLRRAAWRRNMPI